MENIGYPMRINKYLATKNFASRREADKLIRAGLVKINGRTAKLGDKVIEGDKVEVGKRVLEMKELVYVAYNKPLGVVTHSSEKDQDEILDVVNVGVPVFPIGRLDRSSHGLILLTNDGRITDKLLSPKYDHEKEYLVRVDKPIEKHFLKHLGTGIDIEGYKTKSAKVRQTTEKSFNIVLTEGKKHQIRRMCAAFGYVTNDLKRVRIMNIKLGNLKEGQWRKIEGKELQDFLRGIEI